MLIDPDHIAAFQAVLIGFAFAGLLASGFELVTQRRAGFALLQGGGLGAFACVPVVVFSAPFIILRNTVRARNSEHRSFAAAMLAAVIAGMWSLICGRVVLDVVLGLG